jgi:hypothetical protein
MFCDENATLGLLALAGGFAAGYLTRELVSRRRRAIAREEHFRTINRLYRIDDAAQYPELLRAGSAPRLDCSPDGL